jgi:uncharacterized membrane protein
MGLEITRVTARLGKPLLPLVLCASTLGPLAAILAMGGLAISPAHIFWSEPARGYAGMILFTLISNWFYYKLLYRHSLLDSLLFILSSFMAIYFRLFFAFVVISQTFFVLYIAGSQISSKKRHIALNFQSLCHTYISFMVIVALSIIVYSLVLRKTSPTSIILDMEVSRHYLC